MTTETFEQDSGSCTCSREERVQLEQQLQARHMLVAFSPPGSPALALGIAALRNLICYVMLRCHRGLLYKYCNEQGLFRQHETKNSKDHEETKLLIMAEVYSLAFRHAERISSHIDLRVGGKWKCYALTHRYLIARLYGSSIEAKRELLDRHKSKSLDSPIQSSTADEGTTLGETTAELSDFIASFRDDLIDHPLAVLFDDTAHQAVDLEAARDNMKSKLEKGAPTEDKRNNYEKRALKTCRDYIDGIPVPKGQHGDLKKGYQWLVNSGAVRTTDEAKAVMKYLYDYKEPDSDRQSNPTQNPDGPPFLAAKQQFINSLNRQQRQDLVTLVNDIGTLGHADLIAKLGGTERKERSEVPDLPDPDWLEDPVLSTLLDLANVYNVFVQSKGHSSSGQSSSLARQSRGSKGTP